jgi:hypothetical protein
MGAKAVKNVLLAVVATVLAWLALTFRRGKSGQRPVVEREPLSAGNMPPAERVTAGAGRRGPAQARRGADDRHASRKYIVAALAGVLAVTLVSATFIVSFIGGLHDPGPRSVPIGLVGSHVQAARARAALDRQVPGDFTVASYPTVAAARTAIDLRTIDAALVPSTTVQHLIVASAVSASETKAIIQTFHTAAARAHTRLAVRNVRPLHSGDPDGLAMLFFIVALLAPSLVVGNQLITRVGTKLNVFWHLGMIALYAVIVAAVATAIADGWIGALTGAPWAIYGVGALLAFAVAATGAAVTRWGKAIGYLIVMLLFIPVGISSSGSSLGPRMITPWYADLGEVLPPSATQTAVRNVTYFSGHAITDPLLILSAWALASVIALIMAAFLGTPTSRQAGLNPSAAASPAPAVSSRSC